MASPPQGFVVILPGEITQADLDPNQPPAKLSAYPLVAGKDVQPYPEKQLVNDNSGNIATIIGNDTSTVTIPLSKLAALVASFNGRTGAVTPASGDYTQSQITHEDGSVDEAELANDNSGTIATIINADTKGVTINSSRTDAHYNLAGWGSLLSGSTANVTSGPTGSLVVYTNPNLAPSGDISYNGNGPTVTIGAFVVFNRAVNAKTSYPLKNTSDVNFAFVAWAY